MSHKTYEFIKNIYSQLNSFTKLYILDINDEQKEFVKAMLDPVEKFSTVSFGIQ